MRINIRNAAPVAKPTFRIAKKPAPLAAPWSLWSPPFRKLVQDALEASRRVDKLAGPGATKLSAEAFARETLKLSPDSTMKDVQKLRSKLERGDSSLENARSALRVMMKELRGPNLRTPPKAERWAVTERWLTRPRVTEVNQELTRAGSNTVELFAAAVLIAASQNPGLFGSADGEQHDIDAEIAAATKERDDLFARIGASWTAADIDPGKYDRGITSAATFKGTHVHVAPAETAGKRLVESLSAGQRLVEALTKQRKS